MAQYGSTTKEGKDLLPETDVFEFCDSLDDKQRTALAMCIDEEVQKTGLASTRAGSDAWYYGLRCAVTEVVTRELSIAAMAEEHLGTLGETDSTHAEVKSAAKAHKKRIESFAEYLLEETKERRGGGFESEIEVETAST